MQVVHYLVFMKMFFHSDFWTDFVLEYTSLSPTVTSESTKKLRVSFTGPATLISAKTSFPPLVFSFLMRISSHHKPWDFHVEAGALKCPRLVACVPEFGVPWEEMHTVLYFWDLLAAKANQTRCGCGWTWSNTFRSLRSWFFFTSTAEAISAALTNIDSLLHIPNVSVNLSVWTPCHSFCACPVTSAFCYITNFSINSI